MTKEAVLPGKGGHDPYVAKIMQLEAQILQLKAQLQDSGPGKLAGEVHISVVPDPLVPDRPSLELPEFPRESPRPKVANFATINFPEHRLSLLAQTKARIEMDTRTKLQVGAVVGLIQFKIHNLC